MNYDDNRPLDADVIAAFNEGPAPEDVVPRSFDPAAQARLDALPGDSAVTLRMFELDEHGVNQIEVSGLFGGRIE
jgi:hypothetical protein